MYFTSLETHNSIVNNQVIGLNTSMELNQITNIVKHVKNINIEVQAFTI